MQSDSRAARVILIVVAAVIVFSLIASAVVSPFAL
jgi:hypothetical protein